MMIKDGIVDNDHTPDLQKRDPSEQITKSAEVLDDQDLQRRLASTTAKRLQEKRTVT